MMIMIRLMVMVMVMRTLIMMIMIRVMVMVMTRIVMIYSRQQFWPLDLNNTINLNKFVLLPYFNKMT